MINTQMLKVAAKAIMAPASFSHALAQAATAANACAGCG